jgi:hypothetical protein
MDPVHATDFTGIIQFLHEEAPMELERLRSIDRVVSFWPEWAAASGGPCNSIWLRKRHTECPKGELMSTGQLDQSAVVAIDNG